MDLSSTSLGPQILLAIAISFVVFLTYMVMETLYRSYLSYGKARLALYPYTGSAAKTIVFKQDPSNSSNTTLPFSENQLTGIEFTYSCFLYISDDTIGNEEGWKVIFYKGYETNAFPLCGPCLLVSNTANAAGQPTLRVVMNTYERWFNAVDVNQIPFNKWVHVAITCRKNALEVYVNGNLAAKKSFAGTLPYQNYQPLILFPNAYNSDKTDVNWKTASGETSLKHNIPAGENFILKGKFSGYISNLYYFSYAASYSEIQGMMNLGPSSQFDESSMDKPPYLIDSWWVQKRSA